MARLEQFIYIAKCLNQINILKRLAGKNDGAGPIFVNLIHDLDLMNYFFGKVKTVFANICTSKRGFNNEDVSGGILEFKSGIMVTFLCSDSILSPWSWELTARENEVYPNTEETCYFIGGTKALFHCQT